MCIRSCIVVLCACAGLAATAHADPRYRFEPLPAREGLIPWRIGGFNDAGQVATVWFDPGEPEQYVAALFTPGSGHAAIGPASTGGLDLHGMNASGEVVGSLGHWEDPRAWRFAPGAAAFGGVTAGVDGAATGVNDAGVVVGHADSRPWIARPGGTPEPLDLGGLGLPGDINNRGEVLVGGPGGPAFEVYRHDLASGTTTQVRTADETAFTSAILNDAGDVAVTIGTRFPSAGIVRADGSFSALAGLVGYSYQQAHDFNNRGQVLGASFNGGPGIPFEQAAFVYTPGEGTANPFASTAVPEGWTRLSLEGLNDQGDLVGIGQFGDQYRFFVLDAVAAPVAEPASLAMFGLGLLGLGLRARRRVALGGLALLAAAGAQAVPRFTLEALPGPAALAGHTLYTIDGFNDRGQLLTTSREETGFGSLNLYTPGSGLVSIDPGPDLRIGYDLNERGQVAGLYAGIAHVFSADGTGGPVPGLFGFSSYAYALNDRGMVVGQRDGAGAYWYTAEQGVNVIPVPDGLAVDVNDRDVVLVAGGAPGQSHWLHDTRSGLTTELALDARLDARAWLNDTGDIAFQEVGDFGSSERVHVWRDGVLTDVGGVAGGQGHTLLDFNDPGWLLGRSYIPGEGGRGRMAGFLNVPGEGTFALDALIDPESRAGWSTLLPFKLNDSGDIAGWGLLGGEQRLFVLNAIAAPVPEPAAWLLLACGVAAVAGRARHRSRR
ncbi:MAG: PEP-CTERM sorting domain-containing protein [Rhizobacter sp.]